MYKLPGHPGGIPVKIPIFHHWKTIAKQVFGCGESEAKDVLPVYSVTTVVTFL